MHAAATGRVAVGDRRRIAAAPWPVVARDRPHVAGLGLAATGIEHGAARLVAEQLRRRLHQLDQPIVQGLQLGADASARSSAQGWPSRLRLALGARRLQRLQREHELAVVDGRPERRPYMARRISATMCSSFSLRVASWSRSLMTAACAARSARINACNASISPGSSGGSAVGAFVMAR